MLDLKAKLLAAGLVTAEQVKKVEDEEADKQQRDQERREAQRQARESREARRDGRGRGPDGRRDGKRGGRRGEGDQDEKRALRDHKEEEAQRWRKRILDLKAAPKSEQYDVVRGWVDRHRLDDKTAVPSENASRFHFAKGDGTISHVTLEPEVQERLAAGDAGIVAFMGFNGLEHAAVPADLARDIAEVKPEWLRSLAGVTDVTEPGVTDGADPGPTDPGATGAPEAGRAEGSAPASPEEP
jgi:uncharacterized protein YaiL (DUF2058 family)